jgi:hypothetical protein
MKDVDLIIKKTLNKFINEKINFSGNLITEAPEFTFTTYKQPNGTALLIPDNLEAKVNKYNQSEWLTELTNPEAIKANYSNYVSSTNDIYAKSCNDAYTLVMMKEFNEKWADKYIKILDPKGDTPYPSDLDKDSGLKYWFTNKKIHEHFQTPKATDFMGTDYYFLKFSKWLMSSDKGNELKIEKGNISKLNNIPISELMSASTQTPSYLKSETTEVDLPQSLGGGKILADKVETSWFQWSITKNKYCETEGSWRNYYNTMTSFIQILFPDSVSEFEVSSEILKGYLNAQAENKRVEKFNSEKNGRVTFKSCWTQKFQEDGSISLLFNGYYDTVVDFNRETIDNNQAGKCSGNQYPGMAVFLSGGDITYLDPETGNLWTETQGLINVPLVSLNEGYVGKYWKNKTKRKVERNDGDYSWSQFGSDLGLALETTYALVKVGVADASTLSTIPDKYSGEEPTFIDKKETFAMATPLTLGTKGLFKEEDYIDYTKVNEDTEVWRVPKGGLSRFIPGAKKHPRWNERSPNGKFLYQFYYIDYYNSTTGLEQKLPLPTEDWWNGYTSFFYKIKNFVTDKWTNTDVSEVGLCLTINGGDNFQRVIETRGDAGWSFKIDEGTGTMFFTEGTNTPVTYQDLSSPSGAKTITKGTDYSNPNNIKYNEPGELIAYNFMDPKFLDSRSAIGAFWDSHVSTIVSIVVGIAIGVAAAPLAEGIAAGMGWAEGSVAAGTYTVTATEGSVGFYFASQGAFTHSRLAVLVEIAVDCGVLTGPQSIYYFRNGDHIGGMLTLMTAFIPILVERQGFRNWSRSIWSKKTAQSLSDIMVARGLGYWKNLDHYKLFNFLNKLNAREAQAFGELLDQISKGGKAINEIFEKFSGTMSDVLKNSPDLQKRVAGTLKQKAYIFGRAFVPVAGGIAGLQIGIKQVVEWLREKKPTLTEDQIKRLQQGLLKLAENLINRESEFIYNEYEGLKNINPDIEFENPNDWLLNQMVANEDIFNILLEKNGYEKLPPQRIQQFIDDKNNHDKKILDEHLDDVIIYDIFYASEERDLNEEIIRGSIDKRIIGEITDISQVQDKLDLITEYYGCVKDNTLFEFKSAHKTSTGWWWLCFQMNGGTTLKNGWVFFVGKNNSFDIRSLGGLIPLWKDDITDDFNTQFPGCANYIFVDPDDDFNLYKKTKDGKIYFSRKSKIEWKEITNTKQKEEIENKYFK